MKVLFLLFLVFIKYSNSDGIQNLEVESSLTTLKSSNDQEHFYFSLNGYKSYSYIYLLISENLCDVYKIYYCDTTIYPTEESIRSYTYYGVDYYYSQSTSSGKEKYYRIPIDSSKSYIIIKYYGTNSDGTIKARSTIYPFIFKVPVDSGPDLRFSTLVNAYNYLYSSIGYPSSDYLYFYFYDPYFNLVDPIYYCITSYNPENYPSPCSSFDSLSYYDKKPNNNYAYSYRVDTSSYRGQYVILKYTVKYSNYVGIKSSYTAYSLPLSTVAIVFIVIGSVIFVGLIIFLIYYFCKKRNADNISYTPTQPGVATSTPTYPLMEQNNMIQSIN